MSGQLKMGGGVGMRIRRAGEQPRESRWQRVLRRVKRWFRT
jgi:hypothetical protein